MYLVSYDVASDRLRSRIARMLEGYGKRVQYSVFECDLSERRYKELYAKLLQLTEGMEDGNICFYYICKSCEGKKRLIGVPKISRSYPEEDVIVV